MATPSTPDLRNLASGRTPAGKATLMSRYANEGIRVPHTVKSNDAMTAEALAVLTRAAQSPMILGDAVAAAFVPRWLKDGNCPESREGEKIPPFPVCWVEYEWPEGEEQNRLRFGFACLTYEPNDQGIREIVAIGGMSLPGEVPVFPFCAITCRVNADGTFAEEPMGVAVYGDNTEACPYGLEDAATVASPLWAIITMSTCNNVAIDPHDIEPATRKRFEKRFGEPQGEAGYRFHTLRICPVGHKHDRPSNQGLRESQHLLGLHLARGHFKTYSPDRPLFGRLSGKFWWSAHARGTKDRGVIDKNYQVDPPPPEGGQP